MSLETWDFYVTIIFQRQRAENGEQGELNGCTFIGNR
jgi:hypothetical protein